MGRAKYDIAVAAGFDIHRNSDGEVYVSRIRVTISRSGQLVVEFLKLYGTYHPGKRTFTFPYEQRRRFYRSPHLKREGLKPKEIDRLISRIQKAIDRAVKKKLDE